MGLPAVTSEVTAVRTDNPYVGPTSFTAGDPLYGRTRARDELLDLVVAERIVLLYSPSGAGKTSLLQAALIGALEDAKFEVLPIVRVTHTVETDPRLVAPRNRYLLSTLLSLEENVPPHLQRSIGELAGLSLSEYLRLRPDLDGRPGNEVLIFDQFEEVLTADPTDEDAKREFFAELGETLRDRQHWAVFAMREDFLAALDPYLRYVPTRFRTRYRLDLLTADQALEAVVEPAREAGVTFTDDAAHQLVDELRRVRVQRPTGTTEALGAYVEPVQLQVACHRLWSRLPAGATQITEAEGSALGDVGESLAWYYAHSVSQAVDDVNGTRTGVREGDVRDWFEERLITPQGLRGQVLEGPLGGGEEDRALLDRLLGAHLVRAETRRQATWYELAHDSFIEPVMRDNAAWRMSHLMDFQRAALLWDAEKRPDRLLLVGPALAQADADAERVPGPLNARETEFLVASRQADERQQRDLRNAVRMRRLAQGLAAAGVVAVVLLVTTAVLYLGARTARSEAEAQERQQSLLVGTLRNLEWDLETSVVLAGALAGMVGDEGLEPNMRDVVSMAVSASPTEVVIGDHEGPVNSAAISQDLTSVVTGYSNLVQLWSWETGELLARYEVPPDVVVNAVDLDADASTVLIGLDDGSVLLWDVPSGEALPWGDGLDDAVWQVALSSQGDRIAVLDAGGRYTVGPRAGGERVAVADPGTTGYGAAFSPDGSALATISDDVDLVFWDPVTGAERGRIVMAEPAVNLTYSEDGTSLATVGAYGTVTIWDLASGTPLHPPNEDTEADYRAVNRDFTRVISMAAWGEVRVQDLRSGIQLADVFVPGADLVAAVFDPVDETRVLVLPATGSPAVWRTEPAEPVRAVAYEGDLIYSARTDGSVQVVDASGRRRTTPVVAADGVDGIDVDPDGRRVLVQTDLGDAHVWDLETGEQLLALSAGDGWFVDARFSADGRSVVTGDEQGRVARWDASTGYEIEELAPAQAEGLSFVGLSPEATHVVLVYSTPVRVDDDAPTLVAGVVIALDGTEQTATLRFPADAGERRVDQPAAQPVVSAVAMSEDGTHVALATEQGAAAVFDADDGALVSMPNLHTQPIDGITFTRDGRLLTFAADRQVVLSEPESGETLRTVVFNSYLQTAGLTGDGQRVAAYMLNGSFVSLPLDDASLLDLVRSKATRAPTETECRVYQLGC
ncbi:WD40 repeat domain-containing protein [Cellulomonas fimi]|uniref:WD40 repeat domain-containing protein n=1 Tax=Cellulomonas fimi TaxID=1708 RepID=A0A7Y0LUY6_CELFI|nr:WD40 repeat domain-containing protein [Cellulomonas fimi]NMR18687.1 WD40 repeat domain-containing protein [Cellulomonas fimi]